MSYQYGSWKPYVPVAKRRAQAEQQTKKMSKAGRDVQPVRLAGRQIAANFWGKGWCTHLEAFSDFENRLPRGRSYVRNGSVCHLAIDTGRIEALVMGSSLYRVTVAIRPLTPTAWTALKQKCSGEIGSLIELLQGKLSDPVMRIVTDRSAGLFPQPGEMKFECSCPDWATMCKHVAATLYGVGSRLDQQPQLLFQLRAVDAGELIVASLDLTTGAAASKDQLADDQLGAIFGIDFESDAVPAVAPRAGRKPPPERAVSSQTPSSPTGVANARKPGNFKATGRSVAALRKKLGLSVSEFAARLRVAPASVQRWEAEKGTLKLQSRCLTALVKLRREVI